MIIKLVLGLITVVRVLIEVFPNFKTDLSPFSLAK